MKRPMRHTGVYGAAHLGMFRMQDSPFLVQQQSMHFFKFKREVSLLLLTQDTLFISLSSREKFLYLVPRHATSVHFFKFKRGVSLFGTNTRHIVRFFKF